MKKKFLLFSIGVVSILSCAAALSFAPTGKVAKAASPTDLGTVNFTLNSGTLTFANGVHLYSDVENSMPYDWSNRLYPTGAGMAIFNGNDLYSPTAHGIHICKFDANQYYISLAEYPDFMPTTRSEGDTITVKGDWSSTMQGGDYILHINEFTAKWKNGKWNAEFIVPELEPFDKVSLAQIASDDYDRVSINTESSTSMWNTYVASEENTTNSFAFEFAFESYSVVNQTFIVRLGGDVAWDSNHFFSLEMNNTWGPSGVIVFNEKKKINSAVTTIHESGDIEVDLKPGARHTIECASIVVKNSNQVYNYVKYDGEYYYQEVFTPDTLTRTSRISMYYPTNNIFVGGTIAQKENTDTLIFDYSNGGQGIYLLGPENDIPVLDEWNSRAAPASKYNILKNGEAIHRFVPTDKGPFVKHQANEYYIALADYGDTFRKGDVVSFGGEFHFYINGKGYVMAVLPFSAEFNGTQFEYIDDLDAYLVQAINDFVDLDCYDEDQQATIVHILQQTQTNIVNATSIKDKWEALNHGKDLLDEVPMNPDKLEEYKQAAIRQLYELIDETKYEPEQLEIIQSYVDAAVIEINGATSVKRIRDIVEETKAKVAEVTTRQEIIEQRIMALEEGYEEYLASSEVITTTDICAVGDIKFYPEDDQEHESYSSITGPDSVYGRFATNPENEFGNVVMKFKYQSTNPRSCKYQSQVFLRLRGSGSNCYLFDIAMNTDDHLGVAISKFVDDIKTDMQSVDYPFVANREYEIECGAIDIEGYDRTFLFMKIDGEFVLKTIVDRHELNILAPTALFLDCHTADGSGETITLSPSEAGTSKNSVATAVGRPILESKSSSESLTATLRANYIPVGAKLYPMEAGAYMFNGQEVDNFRSPALITKASETQYAISLVGKTVSDGDTIQLGRCYAYYDEDTNTKTIYKLAETSFTYHASSNSWTQSAPSLEETKQEAIDFLNSYVSLDNYSPANQGVIQAIFDEYIERINNATSVDEVDWLLNSAIGEIDGVPTLLDEYKSLAKEELTAYKSPSIYRDAEKAELNTILNNAFSRIDACTDRDSIDYIVVTTKQEIDALKTAAEYEAEELASAKRLAKTEIETYIGLVELDRYTDENAAKIQQLALKARSDVDSATSIDEVRNIVASFKEDIKNVSTKDGSVFDGEKYVMPGNQKKGCGGEIISAAIIVPVLSLMAIVLLVCLRKKYILSK